MRYSSLIITIYIVFVGSLSAQTLNTTLLDSWNPGVTGIYNDIWGYTAPDGTEYVIAGSSSQVHFLRITNTNTLQLVTSITPGWTSSWRDFKTYGQYAYGVTDGGNGTAEGLLIFNLTDIANDNITYTRDTDEFNTAHNIFIDESMGKLYVAGSSGQNNGLIVYNLVGNESAPVSIASVGLSHGYVHDVYVRNDTAYCSHGRGGYAIWNFANPISPMELGNIGSGRAYYNHSSWVTPDGNTVFYAEEVPFGRPITILDISDLGNLDIIGTIKEPLLAPTHNNNVPHNPFLKDGFLYVSYYEDGLQVWDVRDLDNITKVAYYDSSNNSDYNGTDRNWGIYPYFSDRKVVMSDTDNGIHLVQVAEAALPLDFIDFKVSIKSKTNELVWKTSGEYNVSHFEIQHSRDGVEFLTIGQHSTSNENAGHKSYMFQDRSPTNGINYYKIKSVDFDGRINTTNILSVINNRSKNISSFPNPSLGSYNIKLDQLKTSANYHINILNTSGQIIADRVEAKAVQSALNFELALPPGIYLVDLFENEILTWTDRLIISN